EGGAGESRGGRGGREGREEQEGEQALGGDGEARATVGGPRRPSRRSLVGEQEQEAPRAQQQEEAQQGIRRRPGRGEDEVWLGKSHERGEQCRGRPGGDGVGGAPARS